MLADRSHQHPFLLPGSAVDELGTLIEKLSPRRPERRGTEDGRTVAEPRNRRPSARCPPDGPNAPGPRLPLGEHEVPESHVPPGARHPEIAWKLCITWKIRTSTACFISTRCEVSTISGQAVRRSDRARRRPPRGTRMLLGIERPSRRGPGGLNRPRLGAGRGRSHATNGCRTSPDVLPLVANAR